MLDIALGVLGQELTAHRLSGCHVVVAVVADPLSQVVGDIERRRSGDCILVVDEVDRCNLVRGIVAVIREDDHIGAQEITVRENKLSVRRKLVLSSG